MLEVTYAVHNFDPEVSAGVFTNKNSPGDVYGYQNIPWYVSAFPRLKTRSASK